MVVPNIKFVSKDIDRHGNVRYYFRRANRPKIRLCGEVGSAEFMAAYDEALKGTVAAAKVVGQLPIGSFEFVCRKYYASAEFGSLDYSTQKWRRRNLDAICAKYGSLPIKDLEPRHIRKLRDELRDKLGASKTRLKALKALFAWAIENDFVDKNPTSDVKPIHYKTTGYHTWSIEELEQFESFYPPATQARLALSLLLYTACRREDVVRFGPQHIKNGRIRFQQAKNEHRNPIHIDIPLLPELEKAIAATTSGHLTFLVTEYGKPFSANGFGNKFRDWCNAAGLPQCTAHGLRKAMATLLAQRGCSAHEIQSITGHVTLAEVERYTKAVEKSKLADAAMEKFKK